MAEKVSINGENLASVEIGPWILHPSLNRIERDGETIHLEPKAVAVLQLLVERAGDPVSRQELLDAVWQDVIVSDDALTQVIIKLRKALGDDSRRPIFIQTIPKRGYRLVAPVNSSHKESALPDKPKRSIAMLLLIGLATAAAIYFAMTLSNLENEGLQDPAAPLATAFEPMSISILPFVSVGEDVQQNNFARGITSDLSTDLSKLSSLRVISASLSAKGALQARYLVEGNVQQTPGRLKVHARLVDGKSGQQLWSERFDHEISDLFEMQQLISSEIVRQLSVEVTAAEKQRLAKRYTRNLQAYEDFLRAQADLLLRQRESNRSAQQWYRRAIEKDPSFARAYAGLALSYAADFRNQWVDDGQQALKHAAEIATTAQQIDPNIPEVYWVLGYVDAQNREMESALTSLERAIELDRSYADAYALMGGINTYKGEPGKSLPLMRTAMRLRPDAGYLYYTLLGRAYFFLNDFEQAVINLQESLSRNPENLEARIYLAAVAVTDNRVDDADWEADEIRALKPGFQLSEWLNTYPMTDQAQLEHLISTLKPLGF